MQGLKHHTIENENTVLADLKSGSSAALSKIYDHFFEPLFLFAFNVLKDRAAAEDVVQEVFISLWNHRANLEVHSLRNYLYTANRYQVIRVIRQKQKNEMLFTRLEERVWGEPDPENLLYLKELKARTEQFTQTLPEKCRHIYILSREELLSHKEIADKLGISLKTVENQITIALRKLRQWLV